MANGIQAGSSGTFQAQLLDNGSPIALPSGSTWAWSTNDASATVTTVTSDPTGATVTVAIPGADTNATVAITASTVAPNGTTVSFTLTVPITPEAQIFTVTITQTA